MPRALIATAVLALLSAFVRGEGTDHGTRLELLVNAAKPGQALLMKTDLTNNVINITRVEESYLRRNATKEPPLPVRVLKRVGLGMKKILRHTWGALKSLFS